MNFIVGIVLVQMSMSEIDTFKVMISLFLQHKYQHIFDFRPEGGFRQLCFQLEAQMFIHLPEVYSIFKRQHIPVDLYASSWFATLFSNDLSFDIIPNIIDLYMQVGKPALIQIALALLTYIKDNFNLAKLSQDEILMLMSSPQMRERAFATVE